MALLEETIDRVAPTRRPEGAPVMRQRWSELLFLHWPVSPADVQSHLPPGLEVDTFDGRAWLGLVPFTVTGARPAWLPAVPGLSNFHEVNARTYVHSGGVDPGVWFFSLDASRQLVVQLARRSFKLPYHFAEIDFRVEQSGGATSPGVPRKWVRFASRRVGGNPPDCEVRYGPGGVPGPANVGTLEFFLVERYVLYAFSEGRLGKARVHHAPYPLQPAAVDGWREKLLAAAGLRRPETEPLAHYAGGVEVEVFPLRRI